METFFIPIQFNIKNSEHVYLLQQVLVFVLRDELNGEITIDPEEIAGRIYGESTKAAVAFFQSKYGIVQTPEVSEDTVNKLNQLAGKRYRIFGYIMDTSNLPVGGIKLDIQYVSLDNTAANRTNNVMGKGISLTDGSYRVYLDFSGKEYLLDNNGLLKNKLCVNALFSKEEEGIDVELYTSDNFFINDKESIQSFSNEKFIFDGEALYTSLEDILVQNGLTVQDLMSKTPQELQEIASVTDIDVEILMKLALSAYLQNTEFGFSIEASIVFGYIIQNLPYNLPKTLFNDTLEGDDWDYYKLDLQKFIISGIEILSREDHISILSNAVKLRYIIRLEEEEIEEIADELVSQRYELLKVLPILEGDTSLAEISNAIKDIIVDDPAVWTTPSQFTENLIPASKRKEKVIAFKARTSVMSDSIIERDTEMTGGDQCYTEKDDDYTIAFYGQVAYSANLNSNYKIDAFPPFGHYIGVRIRIPEDIDPYEFYCDILYYCAEPQTFYYNDLSEQEVKNGYIHIYINLSEFFNYNNDGHIPNASHSIFIHWGDSEENFQITTNDLFLEPYVNVQGIPVARDFLCTGGETCEFDFGNIQDIPFHGMIEYSQAIHSYGHPSGYYAGVAVFVNDRNMLQDFEWHIYYIYENGQVEEKIIYPDMLTTEEKSGGFVHIYFNFASPEFGRLSNVVVLLDSPDDYCHIAIHEHNFLPITQIERDLELTGGAGCEMHYNSETDVLFSGDIIYGKEPAVPQDGNYTGVYIYPPYFPGEYDMQNIDCYLQNSDVHIYYDNLSDKEKESKYIHVLLNFNNIPNETIHVEWGYGLNTSFTVENNANLLPQGELPYVPVGEGYISQDTSVGGNNCHSTVTDNNIISFYGEIDWLASKGGNFIAVNIFAPADIVDLSHLQFCVKGEWFSYNDLSMEEKNEHRIHIFLSYDTVPSNDVIFVQWKNNLSENFYIVIESGTVLQENPNPPAEQYNFEVWKRKLTELFDKNISNYNDFVSEVKKQEAYLYPATIDTLLLCFDVSRVVMNYTTMILKLIPIDNVKIYGAHYLATFSLSDWLNLIGSNEYPNGIPGDNPTEKRDNYAKVIYNAAQKLEPDIYILSEIERREIPGFFKAGALKEILLERSDFDLLTDQISSLELEDEDEIYQLTIIQNIYKLSPTPQATVEVIDVGFITAEQIYYTGKLQVTNRLLNRISQEDINTVYNAATSYVSTPMVGYSDINMKFHIGEPYVLSLDIEKVKQELENKGIPDVDDLFGDTDYCDCEHDSSVYSAAAYLDDILDFLQLRSANDSSNNSVLYYLYGRRSDIRKMEKNEQNANTIMPYIDLVCEVLEENILYQHTKDTANPYDRPIEQCQSTLSSKELLAFPEHILSLSEGTTTYDILKDRVYPMFAPLNLWQTEIRAYLDLMGIKRYVLMKEFQVSTVTDNTLLPSNADIAAEFFGLTSYEQNIVTQIEPISERNKAWRHNLDIEGLLKMPVTDFMGDSELSIYEIIDICNEEHNVLIRWTNITLDNLLDCTYKGKYVTGSEQTFDRAHRFIRLWRNSGWKIWETDLLLKSPVVTRFGQMNDNLDEVALYNLMIFKQQQDVLGLAAENLLALYGDINRLKLRENGEEIPCLYDRLFLQKALSNPLNERLELIKYNDLEEIEDADQKLIMACLSISETDYGFLKGIWEDHDNPLLNIDYLSFLYRNSILAKKLKIKISDLFTVLRLMGYTGITAYSLPIVDNIIAVVQKIKSFKLSIAEYEYLVNYVYPGTDVSEEAKMLALTQEDLDNYLLQLDTVFEGSILAPTDDQIEEEDNTFKATDAYKEYFTDCLLASDQYDNPDDIAFLIQCIECTSGKTDEEIDEFTQRFFPENPAFYLELDLHNVTLTKNILITRYKNVGVYVDTTAQSTLVYNYISEFFSLSTETTELLLTYPTDKFDERWIRGFFYQESRKDVYVKDILYNYLIIIHKIALLIQKNTISFDEINLLLDTQDKLGFYWFDLKIEENQQTWDTLDDILELNAMLSLHRNYGTTANNQTLLSIINDYTDESSFYNALCILTAWDKTQFLALKDILDFGMDDFYQSNSYEHVTECLSMAANANVSMETLNRWKLRDDSLITEKERSAEIKDAAKAHYDIDTWLDKLPEIQKPIRETKSRAMAYYLILYSVRGLAGNIIWEDTTDLYAYFLLDVEMSACMKVSRLVQATASVQLFVQRCFLNLETEITINEQLDDRWGQWEWMKKYRLWEANRKVFLYPENFIEPELRDDKTSFFKELEDELAQGEITPENVELAFENYLVKLNEIANLTVCGVYNEFVKGDDGMKLENGEEIKTSQKATVHVVAHTKSIPYQYYYRTYDLYEGQWTQWEKIELDIEGDMAIPYVYNRKLHLFWLSVVPKTINQNTGQNSNSNETTKQNIEYTEVQLVWSVLKNNKWTKTNRSQRRNVIEGNFPLINFSLMINYSQTNNELSLKVYCLNNDQNYYVGSFSFDGDVIFVYTNVGNFDHANTIVNDMDWDKQPSKYEQILKIWGFALSVEKFMGLQQGVRIDSTGQNLLDIQTVENTKTVTAVYVSLDTPDFEHANMYAGRLYTKTQDINVLAKVDKTSLVPLVKTTNTDPNLISNLSNEKGQLPIYAVYESYITSMFFYQDLKRSFFIEPYSDDTLTEIVSKILNLDFQYQFHFYPFYHPYTKLFVKELNRDGIKGLLNRNLQCYPENFAPINTYDFKTEYSPDEKYVVYDKNSKDKEKMIDTVDFSYNAAYSMYNWELFFHIPLYLACKLSQNQKFEEAMQWFHYIFNPVTKEKGTSPQKFWITKPFFEMTTEDNRAQEIQNVLRNITAHAQSVNIWLSNPYNPHAVARTRPVAYQRTVVMKYLDNLIAWADQLFRQDSIESNNEATLLYILAYEILGKRPVKLPTQKKQQTDFEKKKGSLRARMSIFDSPNLGLSFSNAWELDTSLNYGGNGNFTTMLGSSLQTGDYPQSNPYLLSSNQLSLKVEAQNIVTFSQYISFPIQYRSVLLPHERNVSNPELPKFKTDKYCLPPNEQLLGYWDTIEDRLFKLRNCMNIEGIVRELPLFEPPIDPAMLVKAAAAGLSISEVLNDITAPQPYYRFRTVIQKAIEYTSEVKQLGDKLLSALEKKDAETLNVLRSTQEINMQQANVQVRKLQIDEAKENVENINALIATTTARKEYYENLEYMNPKETAAYGMGIAANVLNSIVSQLSAVASGLAAIPEFEVGGAGIGSSPIAAVYFGGQEISAIMNSMVISMSGIVQTMDRSSSILLTQASYDRRKEDWDFQAKMATMELNHLQTQLAAAEIRLMVAEKELENMQLQIEQSKSVLEYFKDKYTNEALYNWMITQVSSIYFQSYKLAYDMAKKAEKCYQHELGIYEVTNFIQFGYWDSLHKGLLSGERLMHDLHKLDAAYLDKNKRTLELTKHISLAQMFPDVLLQLITQKTATLDLEEFIFDMDYPGHYMRRIKSVSVTIPNVAGPYTTVSFMLTLNQAKVRKSAQLFNGNQYDEDPVGNDSRFVYQTGGRESICTSSAQNDSGMFEMNFGDERYLPFENAGVISKWGLSLPAGCDQIDLSAISDVIIHINYTSLYDGNLAIAAKTALQPKLPTAGTMLLSLKQQFPDAWNEMITDGNPMNMNFAFKRDNLPYFLRGQFENLTTTKIEVMAVTKNAAAVEHPTVQTGTNNAPLIVSNMDYLESQDMYLYYGSATGQSPINETWTFETSDFNVQDTKDIIIALHLTTAENELIKYERNNYYVKDKK